MSTVTLAEAAKLTQDQLISGVIETIVTVNPFFEMVPFMGISGNALAYNRENVMGDVQMLSVGGTITAKSPATFSKVTSSLTKIIGDAEIDEMIQATHSDQTDQKVTQIASKAKALAYKYQDQMINGDGTGSNIAGLLSLVDASKTIEVGQGTGAAAANGGALSFDDLDYLIDLVTDKGAPEWLMMHRRTIRKFKALCRSVPGASILETITMPTGARIHTYNGIPIFANDFLPTNQVKGTATTCSTVLAGTFDDGTGKHGIAGLTAARAAGIQVKEIGTKHDMDEEITRLKWYVGLACFSLNGLAALKNVL